ncbi:MAG: 2-amino-4-hydroxy-6-hydroxymethyldihydropteridine diphosphokinase [Polyangiaceae bacterium]|nr:2-amino-4-hydroxy-6-hydroxymethyldihydropteridine diphosphokinase [Polyangiaceae bacterium]
MIGLGSNLGDRALHIEQGIGALRRTPGIVVMGCSPLYETPPFGGPPQGDYLNGAVLIEGRISPRQLLETVLLIEKGLGRIRPDPVRWGPRTLDMDVLWIEGMVLEEPGLVVPHPRLRERPFALRPLLDLVVNAVDPVSGDLYSSMAAARAPIARWP